MKIKPELTNDDGEVRELTKADFAHMRPAREVFAELGIPMPAPRKRGAATKEAISIRLSADVVAAFRASGRNWQTRIDDVLREWLIAQRSL